MKQLLAIILLLGFTQPVFSIDIQSSATVNKQGVPTHFATWKYFEADKLASIWLIKRFINPLAKISVVDQFTELDGAVFFDTPSATFTRSAMASTYEHLTQHFDITDPRTLQIGKLIHDSEINSWQTKRYDKTHLVEAFILDITVEQISNEEAIISTMVFFDDLYNSLDNKLEK